MEPDIASLPNFRRLPDSRLYRSSTPCRMEPGDVSSFVDLDITSILDLTNRSENTNAATADLLQEVYQLDTKDEGTQSAKVTGSDQPAKAAENDFGPGQSSSPRMKANGSEHKAKSTPHDRRYFRLEINDRRWVLRLFCAASFVTKLRVLCLLVFDLLLGGRRTVVSLIAAEGLLGMYQRTLVHASHNICAALEVLTKSENVPVLICCNLGKDRTGIIVALALSVLGRSREFIAQDYAKSDAQLDKHGVDVSGYIQGMGLPHSFETSEYSTMIHMFDFIDQRYGSMEGYLDDIGFDEQMRHKLRTNLTDTDQHPRQ